MILYTIDSSTKIIELETVLQIGTNLGINYEKMEMRLG